MQSSLPDLVVFDLETTGLSPRWHEIIQIAAVRLDADGVFGAAFSTYVRPRRPIPAHITNITGITNADVADAPAPEDALRAFAGFVADTGPDATLVAHNGHRFDLRFLAETSARHGLATRPVAFIDSLWLSKKLWPECALHNLDAISERLAISADALAHPRHDARADVHLLATAVRHMLDQLYPSHCTETLETEISRHDFVSA